MRTIQVTLTVEGLREETIKWLQDQKVLRVGSLERCVTHGTIAMSLVNQENILMSDNLKFCMIENMRILLETFIKESHNPARQVNPGMN